MNIAVITYDYPDIKRPVFTFVKALVDEWGEQGHHITVISPFSITKTKSIRRYEELPCHTNVHIIRPMIVSLSYHLKVGELSLTDKIHSIAVNNALNKLKEKPDVIYCHFWKESLFAYKYAKGNDVPIVVASGESTIPSFLFDEPFLSMCRYVSKVICVSSKNKRDSIENGLTTPEKCIVLPNAIDNVLFNVSNQSVLRKQLGISDKDFVVAFVGWFNERKGSRRVSEALTKLANPHIKAIFIGTGDAEPDYPGIVFKGSVSHVDIPRYLNCADVFVLPTLREGCCNAIVEAMACGLPIISSNLDFNWDILDETNSIMVDPIDVEAIARSINQLYTNKKRRLAMSESTLRKVHNLTIESRAKTIIDFINMS